MKPRSRAGTLLASALSAAAALLACAQILNVDGIEIVEAGGAGGGPSTGCVAGTFRCAGPALQLCAESEAGFRTLRVCSSAELCCDGTEPCGERPGCQAPACAPGEFRCSGEVLEACNAGQTGFEEIDRCASPLHCDSSLGRCSDAACETPRRCSGGDLEECAPNLNRWALIDACPSGALCDPAAPACSEAECRIGGPNNPQSPYICTAGDLMRCNDAQTGWEFVETCLNPANCNPLFDALLGDPYAPNIPRDQLERLGCTPPGCAPGRYRCEGAELSLCGADRTGYVEVIGVCESPRHCDASRGRCAPSPCVAGERQCNGDEYRVCTATGWEVLETCPRGGPCDPQMGCLPTACGPNEYRCSGAELERCNVERNGWIPVQTCSSAGLCNVAAKRCDAPVCTPGAARCTRRGALERCNAEASGWTTVADCVAAANLPAGIAPSALCDPTGAGQCLSFALCTDGALRCNGAELQRCRGNAWHPYAHCATPAQCDPQGGGCREPVCDPGGFRCANPGDPPAPLPGEAPSPGPELQVCNPLGTGYVRVKTCASADLCDDDHGQCDICDPSLPSVCSGDELQVCTADGQELTLFKRCALGCVEAGTEGSSRTTCREDLTPASGN